MIMTDNTEKQPLQLQPSQGSYGSHDNNKNEKSILKIKEYTTGDGDDRNISSSYGNVATSEKSSFVILAFISQIILIILYGVAVEYPSPLNPDGLTEDVSDYVYFQQVNVMMFIGFGYLMTFLRRYAFGAITLNMMLTVLCVQWGMFMVGLIDVLFTRNAHKLNLNVDNLAQGDIAAAVILISFGAILGRATPSQLLVMAYLEIILYSINNYILTEILHITDVGGSIVVHTFGCYFGLSVSYVIGKPRNENDNKSDYRGDLFSMIGTLFLWLYWPSFNGIFPNADITDDSVFFFSQSRAFINTLLSLCSCTISTIAMSIFLEGGNIHMVHIQNSTLAGGVAVGAAANLFLTPAGAMAVGLLSAILSVSGFYFITPKIEEKFGVFDTCGINNLHGMPGIFGGIVSSIAIACATTNTYPDPNVSFYYDTFSKQAGFQIIAIIVTLAIAICGGSVVGWIITKIKFNLVKHPYKDKEFFVIPESIDPFAISDDKYD